MAPIPDFVPQEHTELLRQWIRTVLTKEKTSGDKLLWALGAWLAKAREKHPQLQLVTKTTLTRLRNAASGHAGERSSNQLRALWLFLSAHDIYRRYFPESEVHQALRPPSASEPDKLLAFALANFFEPQLSSAVTLHEIRRAELPGSYVMYRPDLTQAVMETRLQSGRKAPGRVHVSRIQITRDDGGMFISETVLVPESTRLREHTEVRSGPLVASHDILFAVMKETLVFDLFKCMVIDKVIEVREGVCDSFRGKILEPCLGIYPATTKFFCQRATGDEAIGIQSYGVIPRQIAKYLKTPTLDPKVFSLIT